MAIERVIHAEVRYVIDHRIPLFLETSFRVFLHTDDCLMSDTEISKELEVATT